MTSRNKKGQFAKQKENPDCEMATRGYVKCLIRRTQGHRHYNDIYMPCLTALAIIGFFTAAFSIIAVFSSTHSPIVIFFQQNAVAFILFKIGVVAAATDGATTDGEHTTYDIDREYNDDLAEYKPPKDKCNNH